jgi:hypothetical protein
MMTEVSPFHEPLPSAAVAVNLLIRHPRIKSLQGVCYTSLHQHCNGQGLSVMWKALLSAGFHRTVGVNIPG